MSTRRLARAVAAATVIVTAGCGIDVQERPQPIPPGELPVELDGRADPTEPPRE